MRDRNFLKSRKPECAYDSCIHRVLGSTPYCVFFIGQHSLLSELAHYTDTAVDYISHSLHITSKDQSNLYECVVRTQNMKLCNKRVFASII